MLIKGATGISQLYPYVSRLLNGTEAIMSANAATLKNMDS